MDTVESVETLVIGAGQAGLATGYHLARRGMPFLVVDAQDRIGDAWRQRWDSLRLFTPARYDGLPGLPFPAGSHDFPTKDEMAEYLETYARTFELPVQTGVRIERLAKENGRYVADAGDQRITARNVVVAMANYQRPRRPDFAAELDPAIVQLHSSEYRNPAQLPDGDVLIVGAGNSGAEIAMDLSKTRRTYLSGRDTGHLPFRIEGTPARLLLMPLVLKLLFHRVLTVRTPMGRRMRPQVLSRGGPLIRQKPKDLAAAGVERVPRTTGTRDGRPVLADDRELHVTSVIWCTGFDPGFSWIDLPVHGEVEPQHERGIVPSQPGLYFVGLEFLYALSSNMIHAVGRDAERVVEHIASAPLDSA